MSEATFLHATTQMIYTVHLFFFFQKIGLNIHIKLFRKKQNKTKLELSADLTIASLQRCQRRNTHCNEIFRFHAYQIHHCRTWQHGNVKPIKEFKSMSYGSLALTLVYTVYQPTLHMCTRFQLVTLQFLRKVLQFFFHLWKFIKLISKIFRPLALILMYTIYM